MFSNPPTSPYKTLHNIKKNRGNNFKLSQFLIDLAKRQREGLKDPNYIRKIINRALTPLPIIEYDECNIYITTWHDTFIIRNANCSANIVIPYEAGINDSPFVPPPQPGGTGIYVFYSRGRSYGQEVFNNGSKYRLVDFRWNHTYLSYKYPNGNNYPNYFRGTLNINRIEYRYSKDNINQPVEGTRNTNDIYPFLIVNYNYSDTRPSSFENDRNIYFWNVDPGFPIGIICWTYERALLLAQSGIGRNYYNYSFTPTNNSPVDFHESETQIYWTVEELGATYIKPPPPPPPPKKKKEDENMACCALHTALLLKILRKLGDADLPATVPTLLTKADSGTTQIQNLAQFISYTVKQLDALTGKYPIDIQIEDSDLTQEGNQTQEIKIANIAEALGEILGILLILRSESDATLSATVRGMIEAGSAKQAATIAGDYAKANAEYLGYKGKQAQYDMPYTFNPNEEKLDQLLQHTLVPYKTWENEDKQDLNDYLAPLLELAAMWKAQNFRKTGANDPSGTIRTILRNSANFINAIDYFTDNPPAPSNQDPDAPIPPKPLNDWDQTLEDIEQGFISKSGISDTLHPYGRDLERRPRIREIGTDTGNEP